MLQELRLENFALVESLEVRFAAGFNCLTGETGAGKSIMIDALAAVLGGRVTTEMIRTGADSALIEAAFLIRPDSEAAEVLAELGFGDGDETLIVSREISANGRSKCRINGRLANVAHLAQVGGRLVDIHGQHDHQSLLSPARHLDLLDALGGDEIAELRRAVASLAEERSQLLEAIVALRSGERERARREDLLQYQIDEIEKARLELDEDEQLEAERVRLAHVERLLSGVQAAYASLSEGDGGAGAAPLERVGFALRSVENLAEVDDGLKPAVGALHQALIGLQEAALELRRYAEGLEADPHRLAQIEERLHLLADLKRKYGDTIPQVLAFLSDAKEELQALSSSEATLMERQKRLAAVEERLAIEAARLSEKRRRLAKETSSRIAERLARLNMPDARFDVAFARDEDDQGIVVQGERVKVTQRGIDRVEFMFSANAGEPLRPLAKVASGGEMSRVMLAIKGHLAEVDPCESLVFDEVDTGVGGRAAESVASALADLARRRQVLVVTHLAQIAVRADRHFTVEKHASAHRSGVAVTPVEGEARVREIARMLDGEATATSLQHAKVLLEMAHKGKTAS